MYSELLETIKIKDKEVYNLSYHQDRVNISRKRLYNSKDILNLSSIIKPPHTKGLYRCRILYDESIKSIEYIPYTPKEIKNIKIILSDIEYELKYSNRDELNNLLKISEADEVIIERNGLLTDTTIANIALYDGYKWWTPKTPLLQGTMRAKLLLEGFLHTKNIKKEDLSQYSHLALMNAMIGFKILKKKVIKL